MGGTFLIDEPARTIRCHIPDFDKQGWQDVLVRRVLPRAAALFGATTIHAACAAVDGGALVLIGASGAGKSTLSAALSKAGWDILSDDMTMLWSAPDPVAGPATTGVCLWADSCEALELDLGRCEPMPGYDGKLRYVSGNDRGNEPVPVRAFVFLDRQAAGTLPTVQALSRAEALFRVSKQRIRFNPGDEVGNETARGFGRLGEIVRQTPCVTLSYPTHYDALPETVAALRGLIEP